jgi:hypothetical protein
LQIPELVSGLVQIIRVHFCITWYASGEVPLIDSDGGGKSTTRSIMHTWSCMQHRRASGSGGWLGRRAATTRSVTDRTRADPARTTRNQHVVSD